jgi:hypothetical protein
LHPVFSCFCVLIVINNSAGIGVAGKIKYKQHKTAHCIEINAALKGFSEKEPGYPAQPTMQAANTSSQPNAPDCQHLWASSIHCFWHSQSPPLIALSSFTVSFFMLLCFNCYKCITSVKAFAAGGKY